MTSTIFSLIAILAIGTLTELHSAFAEEPREYKMVGDIAPVLTFMFKDGVEVHEFPVFDMGEDFTSNSGTSFSVQGTVTKSPLLHKALDEAYKYRFSNDAFDHPYRIFDVKVDFMKNEESIKTIKYSDCRVENYHVETLDSNDYESYFKDVGFAIVDDIDFECSGLNYPTKYDTKSKYADFGESGFNFANNMRTSVTFSFDQGTEKIEFPSFNLISAFEESSDNVVAQFEVEGILGNYPLLESAADKSRKVAGLTGGFNTDFDALVEFTDGTTSLRAIDFKECIVSSAEIITKKDKEEGFTGKSGFAVVNNYGFTCSGLKPINNHYDSLRGDTPTWKVKSLSNVHLEPIQNMDKGVSAFVTFTFPNGVESIEFSMFTQSDLLQIGSSSDSSIRNLSSYPTIELRGIVGNYPLLYKYVDDNRKLQGVGGTQTRNLVDVDVDIVSNGETLRGFNYNNCRVTDYDVSVDPNNEESYVKNKFALENIFDLECQGYHPNNPVYDAMFVMEKAKNVKSNDLRNTQSWGQGFYVE